jgi:hypothetical protein
MGRRILFEERVKNFWSRVNKLGPDDCWLWTGGKTKSGYGMVYIGTGASNNRNQGAHRFAWYITFGSIPDDLFLCHRCDQPACVNPDHLFLGTHTENMRDMYSKRRGPTGDRNKSTKLNWAIVDEIRSAYPHLSQWTLARRYGVGRSTIRHILDGTTWKEGSRPFALPVPIPCGNGGNLVPR